MSQERQNNWPGVCKPVERQEYDNLGPWLCGISIAMLNIVPIVILLIWLFKK